MTPTPPPYRWAVAAWLTLLFLWTLSPLAGFDFWFYLAVGRDIWQTKSIPWSETYLGTTTGFGFGKYADQAWLGNLVCYFAYFSLGWLGLVLLKSGLLTGIAGLTYANCRRVGLNMFWAGAWSTLALWTIRGRFEMRTYLFSDLALAILVTLLICQEQKPDTQRTALRVFLLCAVWTNLHQGIVAGFVVGALWLLFGRGRLSARLTISSAALLASLIRPNPLSFPLFLYDHFSNSTAISGVVEWAPPSSDVVVFQLGLFLLTLTILLPFGLWKIRAQQRPAPPWAYLVIAAAFLIFALRSMRSISELLPVVCPLTAAYFPEWKDSRWARGAVALVLAGLCWGSFAEFSPADLRKTNQYPEALVQALPAESRQIFNSFEFGNYLIFQGIPPFLHGMTGFYREELITDFEAVLNPTPRRDDILRQFGVDAVLLHMPEANDATLNLTNFLFDSPDWKLSLWDDTGLLFVKGNHQDGLQAVRPWHTPRWNDPVAAQKELQKLLEERPSALAHLFLSQLLLENGESTMAIQQANLALELAPGFYPAWSQLGLCYAKSNNLEGVLRASERGLRLGGNLAPAHFNRALALHQKAQRESGLSAFWTELSASYHARRALWLDPNFQAASVLLRQL